MQYGPLCSLKYFCVSMLVCTVTRPAIAAKPTPPTPPPPVRYGITWLNALGQNDDLQLWAVNSLGTTAVGSVTSGGVSKAISVDTATGSVVDLSTSLPVPEGWNLTAARGITSTGKIAGTLVDDLGQNGLFVHDPASATPFQSIMGGFTPIRYRDMNDMGDLLYAQSDGTTVSHYVYTNDDKQSHQLPSSLLRDNSLLASAGPVAINGDRLIAGNYEGLSDATAYLYDYGSPTGTVTAIPPYFRSVEINDRGTVVGRGLVKTKGGMVRAVTFNSQDGKKQLTDEVSFATAVNELGQVVGEIGTRQNNSPGETAFIYDPIDGFWSLHTLLRRRTLHFGKVRQRPSSDRVFGV
jgi:hypothetical protein